MLEAIDNKIDKKFSEAKEYLATKADLAEVKADIIKWMFIFLGGQMAQPLQS